MQWKGGRQATLRERRLETTLSCALMTSLCFCPRMKPVNMTFSQQMGLNRKKQSLWNGKIFGSRASDATLSTNSSLCQVPPRHHGRKHKMYRRQMHRSLKHASNRAANPQKDSNGTNLLGSGSGMVCSVRFNVCSQIQSPVPHQDGWRALLPVPPSESRSYVSCGSSGCTLGVGTWHLHSNGVAQE